jgi:hypothetical protein
VKTISFGSILLGSPASGSDTCALLAVSVITPKDWTLTSYCIVIVVMSTDKFLVLYQRFCTQVCLTKFLPLIMIQIPPALYWVCACLIDMSRQLFVILLPESFAALYATH